MAVRRVKGRKADPNKSNADESNAAALDYPIKGSNVALVLLLAVACFLNSLNGELVFDDTVAIRDNPDVLGRTPLSALLLNDFWGRPIAEEESHKSYRPITVLTFRLNHMLSGLDVIGFHIVNVALHGANSVMLFKLARDYVFSDRGALWQPSFCAAVSSASLLHQLSSLLCCGWAGVVRSASYSHGGSLRFSRTS